MYCNSVSRPMSIKRPGDAARRLSCGMRLCPPASSLALPPCFDKASSAPRTVGGRSYSKTGGFIDLPFPDGSTAQSQNPFCSVVFARLFPIGLSLAREGRRKETAGASQQEHAERPPSLLTVAAPAFTV